MTARGLYESLLTEALGAGLNPETTKVDELRNAEAADRIARHVASVVERTIEGAPEDQRAAIGIELARRLVNLIASSTPEVLGDTPDTPGRVLRAILSRRPDGNLETIEAPLIPLLDTALLTNSPGEPRVGRQIQAEIESADRIDVVMAFIRRSGLAPLKEQLRRHVSNGRKLRVLTTAYTGSTEPEAIELLLQLGADVRVSYDLSSTRLHAKAWLFHRHSGFSTAYVGSSNLTHAAQVDGLEWNVRVSGARNRIVIEKIAAVFETYWQHADFQPYDRERFSSTIREGRGQPGGIFLSPIEIRLEPFQERLLEQVELSREQGYHRNLLVSATGTGKTVMAAVDYSRLRMRLSRARLLFVAHREEILEQSRATFAHALRDGNFGELWVGGRRPVDFEYVFASIQSLSAAGLAALDPRHFDVVIIDEFHHAAAASYERLLEHVQPEQMLGLTATPERSDGIPILHWFGDRIAAELRLWDAIDQHRLTPFAYYGIADELDLTEVPWRRGRGYDVEGLTNLITSTDVWAKSVLSAFHAHCGAGDRVRALGFCVSVDHARYMSRVFNEHGGRSVAIWADTPEEDRRQALTDLAAGRVNVVFSVDLFNEGVDVPSIDTLLMLRPTESPLLFLQQLGRGLRRSAGKSICTVLDFVGRHRSEFRYDRRFQALLGGSRASVRRQVEMGFPFLPAGCHMQLDRVASARVLDSIRRAVPQNVTQRADELRRLNAEIPGITLARFLDETTLELEEVYASNNSWSDLLERAGLPVPFHGPHERILRRACGRLLHVDDPDRLGLWSGWVANHAPPEPDALSDSEQHVLRMLLVQLLSEVPEPGIDLRRAVKILWDHPAVLRELRELFDVLRLRVQHVTPPLSVLPAIPLRIHARYTRLEILAACNVGEGVEVGTWQSGVFFVGTIPADLFAFTLDKTSGNFSPNTRYRDYAISRDLIHWESQSTTRADSETGRRYQNHSRRGSHVLLFARLKASERAFYFLGPATYVNHIGEQPMAITWKLHHEMPGDLYELFAAAVA